MITSAFEFIFIPHKLPVKNIYKAVRARTHSAREPPLWS